MTTTATSSRELPTIQGHHFYVGNPQRIRRSMKRLADPVRQYDQFDRIERTSIDQSVQGFIAEKERTLTSIAICMHTTTGKMMLQDLHHARYTKEQMRGQEFWAEPVTGAPRSWTSTVLRYFEKVEACVAELSPGYRRACASVLGRIAHLRANIRDHKDVFDHEAYLSDLSFVKVNRRDYLRTKQRATRAWEILKIERGMLRRELWIKGLFVGKKGRADIRTEMQQRRKGMLKAEQTLQAKRDRYYGSVAWFNSVYQPHGKGITEQRAFRE